MAAYIRVWGPIAVHRCHSASVSANLSDFADDAARDRGGRWLHGARGARAARRHHPRLGGDREAERPTRSESARVYALHLGYHVDPADMGDARHAFRDGLLGTIAERARGLAAMGYRMNADPAVAWPHVALDPTHDDDALITAAFTLARLDRRSRRRRTTCRWSKCTPALAAHRALERAVPERPELSGDRAASARSATSRYDDDRAVCPDVACRPALRCKSSLLPGARRRCRRGLDAFRRPSTKLEPPPPPDGPAPPALAPPPPPPQSRHRRRRPAMRRPPSRRRPCRRAAAPVATGSPPKPARRAAPVRPCW